MDRSQLLNDAEIALRLALDGRQSSMWTALPGIITAVDLSTMTCTIQPAIQGTVENEDGSIQSVDLPVLIHVPICFPSAGGFIITLPMAVNDEVLVLWACRCIDAWWQSGGIQRPMEARMHDMSDGFALPGPRSIPHVPGSISTTDLQIRNNAGTTYLSVTPGGKIKMVAPSGVEITGSLTVSGEVIGNGIHLSTHTHSGVTPGGGTSGPPVP